MNIRAGQVLSAQTLFKSGLPGIYTTPSECFVILQAHKAHANYYTSFDCFELKAGDSMTHTGKSGSDNVSRNGFVYTLLKD